MDIQYYPLNHNHKSENCVAHLQWRKALADIKSGKRPIRDDAADSHCLCRSTYKLQNIDHAVRTPLETDAWIKVLGNAEMQARARAV